MPKRLDDLLFEIDQGLVQAGYKDGLDAVTMGELARRLKDPHNPHVWSAIQSGQWTAEHIVEESVKGLQALEAHPAVAGQPTKPATSPVVQSMQTTGQAPPSDLAPYAEGAYVSPTEQLLTGRNN